MVALPRLRNFSRPVLQALPSKRVFPPPFAKITCVSDHFFTLLSPCGSDFSPDSENSLAADLPKVPVAARPAEGRGYSVVAACLRSEI